MVNPYTDPRYAMARLMAGNGAGVSPAPSLGPTPSAGAVQLGRTANNIVAANPSLRDAIASIASGQPQKKEGILGNVLGNPIVKTALNGLDALSIPGRAVVSGIREVADTLDSDSTTKASWGDFGRQTMDKQFGFGKAFKINTGNIWVDRAIGFVGDVALDPLTYATFGASAGIKGVAGTAKLGNYGSKLTLAAKVLEKTGDDVLAKAVARTGRSALKNSPDVLERVGANKFGVYFFGKRVKVGKDGMGLRVPFSGTIGEIGEATIAKARLGLTDTKAGKYFQKMTMPKDFLDLRLKVARGSLSPEDTADALKLFQVVPKQRLARATAMQTLEQQLMTVLKSEEPNIESYRASLYKFIEDPTKLASASPSEKAAHAVWTNFLEQNWKNVESAWKAVDENADIGKSLNYFPRVQTDAAAKWMRSNPDLATGVRAIFLDDPFSIPGAFTPRSLRPGKKWFGKVLEKQDMNIESLNRIARTKGGIDFDFFETDVINAMTKYISDTADELGIISRNSELKDAGFFRRIDEQRIREQEVNADDVASAKNLVEEQDNIMAGVEQSFREAVVDLTTTVRAEATRVSQGLATAEGLRKNMSTYLYDMMESVARQADTLEQTKQRLWSLFGPETEIPMYSLSDDFPVMMRPMLGEFDSMVDELAQHQELISDLHAQSMKEGYDAISAETALRQIEDSAAKAGALLKSAQESIRSTMEIGTALEGSWEAIVNGRLGSRIESSIAHDVVKNVREILGSRSAAGGNVSRPQTKRAQALGVKGALKDWMRNSLNPSVKNDASADFFQSFWNDISGSGLAGIKPTAVTDMKEDKLFNIILNAATPDATVADLRQAAAHVVGRDIRLYGAKSVDDLPRFVRRFHEEIRTILKETEFDEAQRIARSKASQNLKSKIQNLTTRWGSSYEEAVNIKNTLDEYTAVGEFLRNGIELAYNGPTWRDIEFTEDLIPALEEAAGGSRLPWLYDYIDEADIVLGKQAGEFVSLDDVINHVDDRAAQLKSAYYDDTVEIEDVISANLLQNQSGEGRVMLTREMFVEHYDSKLRQALKAERKESFASTEFNMSKSAQRRMRSSTVGDEVSVKRDLAESLVQYQAVSDAVQKFEAVAAVLTPHGLVPTEDMWRGILRTVSNQYGVQYRDKVRRMIAGESKFKEFHNSYTKKLQEMKRLPVEEQIPVSTLFKEAFENMMNGPDGDVMNELVGPSMSRLVDKADMRQDIKTLTAARDAATPKSDARVAAQASLDRYAELYVIPWAKAIDPSITAKKGPAIELLKNLTKQEGTSIRSVSKKSLREHRTALSRDASEVDIQDWFNSMLDKVDPGTGSVVAPGSIAQMRNSYQGSEIFFRRMQDGYLDIEGFFKSFDGSAHTPASYSAQMNELADRLQGVGHEAIQRRKELEGTLDKILSSVPAGVELSGSKLAQFTRIQNELKDLENFGATYIDIYKNGGKIVAGTEREARNAEIAARSAREVADAFKNPNLTQDELKAVGFTNKTMREAHALVADLLNFEASVDYSTALNDKDMISFLDSVAGVDFSQFDEGIVVGTNRVEKFADDVVPESIDSVQADIDGIIGKIEALDVEEKASMLRTQQPYVYERDGKTYYKPDSRSIAQRALDTWKRREQTEFNAMRLKLNGQLDTAKARLSRASNVSPETIQATRTVTGYDVTPVFAKLPDGNNIKFTKAEWDSLYIPAYNQEGLKNAGDAARVAVKRRKEIMDILGNLSDENIQRTPVSELQAQLRILKKEPSASWSPGKKAQITRIERQIAGGGSAISPGLKGYVTRLQRELAQLEQQIPILEGVIERNMKVVRNSALEKVRILVGELQKATPQNEGAHWMSKWQDVTDQLSARTYGAMGSGNTLIDDNWTQALPYKVIPDAGGAVKRAYANDTFAYYFNKIIKQDQSINSVPSSWGMVEKGLQSRRNSLQAMWRSNKSYATLQKHEELATYAAMSGYEDFGPYADKLEKAATKARKAADGSRMMVNDSQASFKKAIDDMRNSELQAAKAAGAVFDTKSPFWATNKEVKYVLNGKEYSVPSVNDMLKDPQKYINRARKRGDFFFDLKKPGNVTMWNEASEEARASMSLFGLQNVVMNDTAKLLNEAVVEPSFARSNEVYNIMSQWSESAKTLSDNINSVRAAIDAEQLSIAGEMIDFKEALVKTKLDVFEFASELRASLDDFDPSIELSQNGIMQMDSTISALQKRTQALEELAGKMPTKADSASWASAKKPKTVAKWRDMHVEAINENRKLLQKMATIELADGKEAKVWDAMLKASVAETRFMLQESRVKSARTALDNANAGVYVDRVLKPATKEFDKAVKKMLKKEGRGIASDFNMPGYSVSSEINEVIGNLKRINDGALMRELGSFLGTYTGFFKGYATLSPGFHVRNSISNTFQLFAAGAEVKNMRDGLRLWKSLGEHIKSGGTNESWLTSGTVPKGLEKQARIASEVTLALGGGQTDEAFAEFLNISKNVLTDNAAIRTSKKFGGRVEGSARFMLAFDSAMKGDTFNEAFDRTGRFLVDYNNPTLLDESVRNIIPFWTWMSRNIPLQIVTQWTNPKPYIIYKRFSDNFRVQDDEDEQLPEYLRNKNPIKVGSNTFLALDTPFQSIQETIGQLNTPKKLLSMVNPALRVPMEVVGGESYFTGAPIDNGAGYAAKNLLPFVGQYGRITDSPDQLGLARYLGLPLRGTSEESRNNELMRRMYEIQNQYGQGGGNNG